VLDNGSGMMYYLYVDGIPGFLFIYKELLFCAKSLIPSTRIRQTTGRQLFIWRNQYEQKKNY